MKKYLLPRIINKATIVALAFLISGFGNQAIAEENHIIITGQVTNTQYGNPLKGHKVYIQSDLTNFSSTFYYNALETDDEGFFYDTISAEIDYGLLDVFTYDHQGALQKETLHYRFYEITNNNTFLVNFNLYMPFTTPNLQAKFRFVKKVVGDKFRFKFVDNTQNEEIKSWHWEFGDGTSSDEPYPDHTYLSCGMFKVSLTVEAIANGHPEVSTISKYVHVPLISFFDMGGHCFADLFPIDEGQAVLYSVDENNFLTAFDTTFFDTLGYYWFYQVPEGEYCVKVQPDDNSAFYNLMIPTYYGNTSVWKEAIKLNLNSDNKKVNINLIESSGIESGLGNIDGIITFTNSDKSENDYASEGVPVYLLDAFDNPMKCCYTDKYGAFNFGTIAIDTYWVYPEVTGYDSDKMKITLTETQYEVDDLEVVVYTDQAHLIVPGDLANNDHFLGFPFPNPATDIINFELFTESEVEAEVEVVDMRGRIIYSESIHLEHGINEKQIRTNKLTRGMYFIRVSSTEFTKQRRFVISR